MIIIYIVGISLYVFLILDRYKKKYLKSESKVLELKGDESQIKHEYIILQELVESLKDGIVMIDQYWNLSLINSQARKMFSIPSGEIGVLDIFNRCSDNVNLRSKIEGAIKKSSVVKIEEISIEKYVLQVTIIPVTKGKELHGTVIVFRDITHEKDIQRLHDEFQDMVIHDLRSPLTSIRGAAENIQNYFSKMTKEEMMQSLQIIESEISDMMLLVNGLLDISKLDSGTLVLNKTVGDFRQTIQQVVEQNLPSAEKKNLQIQYESDDDLPNFLYDQKRISQVLNHLIKNAITFTPEGSIVIKSKKMSEKAQVTISDTGKGIAKDKIAGLFTRYSHSQPQKNGYGKISSGVGLVLSHGIIEAHGGKIRVESKEGAGSRFIFTLPL